MLADVSVGYHSVGDLASTHDSRIDPEQRMVYQRPLFAVGRFPPRVRAAIACIVLYWLGETRILKHTQFLCQFLELRKLNKCIGVERCGVVVRFGQYTEIAVLVSLFGFTIPAYIRG